MRSEEEIEKTFPFPPKPSEERVIRTGKILRIEVLGSPTDSETSQTVVQPVSSEDTRAKTVQGSNGMLQIPEDRFSDYNIVNYDSATEHKVIPKLTITGKKKFDVIDSTQTDTVSARSFSTGPGLSFHPEKLKYLENELEDDLENEGVVAKLDLEKHLAKFKDNLSIRSGSITESVPSNPELGFGIPRLASKKTEINSGQPKKSPQVTAGTSTQRAKKNNDYFKDDILPGKLIISSMTEVMADKPTPRKQTDETKDEEDCQYCVA